MATLCKPSLAMPEYTISYEDTLEVTERLHSKHPQLETIKRLIANVGVEKRHIIRPLEETLLHPGFEQRNLTYVDESKKYIPIAVSGALKNAGLRAEDIDAIIFMSCTGFVMPSMIAWMINNLGFRPDVVQLPIAQLGCAAGGTAVNRAFDYCQAYPEANVLIVSCELCSACYQPTDLEVGSLLSAALFGDAIASAVMRGKGGKGVKVTSRKTYLLPNSESWIRYEVKETGFHFRLAKNVPGAMQEVTPVCQQFVQSQGWDMAKLDYYVVHTGGPRILNALRDHAGVDESALEYSRTTLRECGNIASASIFDVLRRIFEKEEVPKDSKFIIIGLGPGMTAEFTLGVWE